MTAKTVNIETAAVSKKLLKLIEEEERRLIDSGADDATIGESILSGAIVALALTFRKSGISDDEVLMNALRLFLRDYDEKTGKAQPHH
jgi:hypothetical protein